MGCFLMSPGVMEDDKPLMSDTVKVLPFSDCSILTSRVGKKFIPKASSEENCEGMVPLVGIMGTGTADCWWRAAWC